MPTHQCMFFHPFLCCAQSVTKALLSCSCRLVEVVATLPGPLTEALLLFCFANLSFMCLCVDCHGGAAELQQAVAP
jgi:hypothetical protein